MAKRGWPTRGDLFSVVATPLQRFQLDGKLRQNRLTLHQSIPLASLLVFLSSVDRLGGLTIFSSDLQNYVSGAVTKPRSSAWERTKGSSAVFWTSMSTVSACMLASSISTSRTSGMGASCLAALTVRARGWAVDAACQHRVSIEQSVSPNHGDLVDEQESRRRRDATRYRKPSRGFARQYGLISMQLYAYLQIDLPFPSLPPS